MRRHILTVAIALGLAAQVGAQTDSLTTWPIDSRVRVWTAASRNLVGYLTDVRGDTLLIVAPGASGRQTRMLADSAARLEVSDGRVLSARNVAGGALGGGALAVATVAVLKALLDGGASCTVGGTCIDDPDYGRVALFGGAVGAIVGALKLEDQWREVRIPGRVSFVPSPRHSALTLSFSFR